MPTNYTPNYNLNQWARSDQVLMEDFNADNAKIDAALGEASRLKLLQKIVTAQDSAQVDIDLSGLDLSEYLWLELWFNKVQFSQKCFPMVRLNHVSENYFWKSTSSTISNKSDGITAPSVIQRDDGTITTGGMIRLYLSPAGLGGITTRVNYSYYENKHMCYMDKVFWGIATQHLPPENLSVINYICPVGTVLAGSHMTLLGFKL